MRLREGAVPVAEGVESALLLVAAMLCATSVDIARHVRLLTQVVLIALTGAAALYAGMGWPGALLISALSGVVAALATSFAADVRASRDEQRRARAAATRRETLLSTARLLPEQGVEEAAAAATGALRRLGFDSAGIGLVRDGVVVPLHLDSLPPPARPLSVHQGAVARVVEGGRTVALADYQLEPERLPGQHFLRAMILTPIRADSEVVGVLMCARRTPGRPDESEVEIAEVLAAHLGGAIGTRRQLQHQRLLLERMDRLDAMRTVFADEVSYELRDPLTVVRSAGHTLRAHGDAVSATGRQRLLVRLCSQAEQLRDIVEALLDFSRFQAAHRSLEPTRVELGGLLEPFAEQLDLGSWDADRRSTEVEVEPDLIRHALSLLLEGQQAHTSIVVDERRVELEIVPPSGEHNVLLPSLVAQLVLEGGGAIEPGDTVKLTLLRPDHDLAAIR